MKSIEELGISLPPWEKHGDIVEDAEGNVIFHAWDDPDFENAKLFAEAPEMYECLREAVEDKCRKCKAEWYGKCVTADRKDCEMVAKWKSVLARAGGAA